MAPTKRAAKAKLKKTDDIVQSIDDEVMMEASGEPVSSEMQSPSHRDVQPRTVEDVATGQKRRRNEVADEETSETSPRVVNSKRSKAETGDAERRNVGTQSAIFNQDVAQKRDAAIDYPVPPAAIADTNVASPPPVQQPIRTVPAVDNLRMPSAHTPGKTNVTTASIPTYSEPDIAPAAVSRNANRRVGLNLDALSQAAQLPEEQTANDDTPATLDDNIQQEPEVNEANDPENQSLYQRVSSWLVKAAEHAPPKIILRQPVAWFLFFLLPQMFLGNFFLSAVVKTSTAGRDFYKGLLPFKPTNESKLSESPRIRNGINTIGNLLKILKAKQTSLQDRKDALNADIAKNFKYISSDVTPQLRASGAVGLTDTINKMRDTVGHLSTFISLAEDEKDFSFETLELIRDNLDHESALIDLTKLELWEFTESDASSCVKPSDKAFITENEISVIREELLDELWSKVESSKSSPEVIEAIDVWIQSNSNDLIQELLHTGNSTIIGDETGRSAMTILRKLVSARLELERADQTGLIDYALIANGASVIKTGPFATSPSLVQNLPFLNRLAHSLQLRFYGYGPEAALIPTHPRTALGQCWAFEKDINSVYEFGVLSVRLAKPIHVDEISIEHPSAERTDRLDTAIRSFQVYGFEDPDASFSDKKHLLGTFVYQIGDGSSSLQRFSIAEHAPLIRAVSLVVESTWGGEYTCLYRFRVHGNEDS